MKAFLPVLAVTLLVTTPAVAYERQFKLGGGLGYQALKVSGTDVLTGTSFPFPALQIDAQYGVTDMFNVFAEVTASELKFTREAKTVPGEKKDDPPKTIPSETFPSRFAFVTGHVGVAYTLDVLRWVPYFGVGIGVSQIRPPVEIRDRVSIVTRPSTVIALGLDYSLTREIQLGGSVRLFAAAGDSQTWTGIQAFARAGYTWGW